MVDLGGSLAVASMGLFATGVSTDLNGRGRRHDVLVDRDVLSVLTNDSNLPKYRRQGRRPDTSYSSLREEYEAKIRIMLSAEYHCPDSQANPQFCSRQDSSLHDHHIPQREGRAGREGKSYKVRRYNASTSASPDCLQTVDTSPKHGALTHHTQPPLAW